MASSAPKLNGEISDQVARPTGMSASAATSMAPATAPNTILMTRANDHAAERLFLISGGQVCPPYLQKRLKFRRFC